MKHLLALAVLSAASFTSGCGLLDPRPDPSRFFVLATLQDLGSTIEPCTLPGNTQLGLGPVRYPDYLQQPELLTRTSPTEITRSITDRWSEPIETMLPRVLSDDLSQILHPERIQTYPWYATDRPAWQIEIDILRFEPDTKGEVSLIARWKARELAGASRSVANETRVTKQAASLDPAQRAQAMSLALGALAEDIARSLCALAATK